MRPMTPFSIPSALIEACRRHDRQDWLESLPQQVEDIAYRWSIVVGEPFQPGGQTAWVAPVHAADFGDVVLKVGMRLMEGEDEATGLREWDGDGAVHVFADEQRTLCETCRERPVWKGAT